MGVGSGVRERERIPSLTSGYLIRTTRAKRFVVVSKLWGRLNTDERFRLTQLEIIFGSSFQSLAVCVAQVGGAPFRDVVMLNLPQKYTNPLPRPRRNWGIHCH